MPDSRRDDVWGQMGAIDTKVDNPFSDDKYKTQFDYNAMKSSLDEVYAKYKDLITGNMGQGLADTRRSTVRRLASEGISGGSIVNSAVRSGEGQVLRSGYDALQQLGIGQANAQMPLMQQANQNQFQLASAKGDFNYKNLMAQLQKAGMLQGAVNDWENMDMQRDSQPGAWDDVLGGISAVGQIALPIITGGASLPFQAGAAASSAALNTSKNNMSKNSNSGPTNGWYKDPNSGMWKNK